MVLGLNLGLVLLLLKAMEQNLMARLMAYGRKSQYEERVQRSCVCRPFPGTGLISRSFSKVDCRFPIN